MKNIVSFLLISILSLSAVGQTNIPQLVSFSAVVRDANNQAIVNTPISIRLTFRESGQTGPLVYCALHQTTTNQSGFMSIQLNRDVLGTGCNGAPSNIFEDIMWENGGFWMEVEYQIIPGDPFENLGQLELASSFYAFAAGTAESISGMNLSGANDGDVLTFNIISGKWEPMPSAGGFSGDYNDLTNAPTIPTVPTNLSSFTNDAGYVTTSVDSDADSTNELQALFVSATGDTLHLQNGGYVIIPGISQVNYTGPPILFPGDSSAYISYCDSIDGNWTTNLNSKRYILLEDYTGHRCTNCPNAAIIAEELENDTALGVVVVGIHASPDGSFQATDGTYQTDFTTEAGDIYVVDMPGMFANPMGTVNRKSNGLNGSVWHLANSWETAVNQETNQPLLANIQVKTSYFPSTNGLFVHTETEFKDNLSGNYHLIIYLLRKSVISPQSMNDGSTNYNYNHQNVLSDNINGTWGTEIASGTITSASKFYSDFSYELISPLVDSTYELSNLSLVTYICERNTFEIIQVIKTDF